MEKECLEILLRGKQPIVIVLARGLDGARLPSAWKKPLQESRLLVLSPFSSTERRVTKELAIRRNRLVAALADEIVFGHIKPGGQLDQLRQIVAGWAFRTGRSFKHGDRNQQFARARRPLAPATLTCYFSDEGGGSRCRSANS